MSVYRKLMEVRVSINRAGLKKSGKNAYAGYEYFELGDFLPLAQEVFLNHGLAGVVSFGKDVATLTIADTETGDKVEITSPMAEAMIKGCTPVQNLGASETYIRRYLWMAALELSEHDVLDATTGKEKPKGVHTPSDNAIDRVDEKRRNYVADVATAIRDSVIRGNMAAAHDLVAELTDPDERVAAWALLDSKVRRAIKDDKEARKIIDQEVAA
jgi:hypothetical protein